MLAKSLVNALKLGFENALCFRIKLAPIGTYAKEIEIDELLFRLNSPAQTIQLVHKSQPAELNRFLLCINAFHFLILPIVPSFQSKVQTMKISGGTVSLDIQIYKNR